MTIRRKLKRSPALKRAQDKYYSSHKKEYYLNVMRSHCKNYILKKADAKELEQVEGWLRQAKENLKK